MQPPDEARPAPGAPAADRPPAAARTALLYEEATRPQDPLADVKAWIEHNQTLAVLGGFAVGVFIGAWMRR